MAFVRPLYKDASNPGILKEMSLAQVGQLQQRAVYVYGSNPSALLTVVGSSGSLDSMTDTRMQSGTATTDATNFDDDNETPNITPVTPIVYDRINQANSSVSTPTDTNNKLYPVYYDGSGSIQAMNATDVFDTIINAAIGTLVDGNDRGGTFRIFNATSLSLNTLISSTPVFTDTIANASAYIADNIGGEGTVQDIPTTENNYYLFRTNQTAATGFQSPLQITSGNDLQIYTNANLDAMLLAEMRHHTVNTTGSRITYSINGSGANRGTGMADKRLDGAGVRRERFVSVNDYRTQEFPNGTAQTETTYFLKIARS